MQNILETERLFLRYFETADAAFMLRLVNDPAWLKYIGDRKVYSLADAEQYLLNGSIKSYGMHGFGFYGVGLKQTNELIGTCGMAKRDFLDMPDFGFAFLPEYTGAGYAYEVAKATLKYAEEALAISSLLAITLPENIRSIHLLEKLGFKRKDELEENGDTLYLYRIG